MKKIILILLILLNLKVNAQNAVLCDSIDYLIGGQIDVCLNTAFTTPIDDIAIFWSVCDDLTCYSETGVCAIFNQIQPPFPNIKLCYDVIIDYNNTLTTEFCSRCDSLEYDQSTSSWNIFYTSTGSSVITSINDISKEKITNNKMYDLFGREINKPKGMYIKNNKLHYVK